MARRAGISRPAVWRWQRRFAGVEGLLRDKTRLPGKPPLAVETVAKILALPCSEPPGEATHWTGRAVAKATGLYEGGRKPSYNRHSFGGPPVVHAASR